MPVRRSPGPRLAACAPHGVRCSPRFVSAASSGSIPRRIRPVPPSTSTSSPSRMPSSAGARPRPPGCPGSGRGSRCGWSGRPPDGDEREDHARASTSTVSAGARSSATRMNGVSRSGTPGSGCPKQPRRWSGPGRHRDPRPARPCSRRDRGAGPGKPSNARSTAQAAGSLFAIAARIDSSIDGSRAIIAVASRTSAAPGIGAAAARRSRSSAVAARAASAASASASASITLGRSAGSRGRGPMSATRSGGTAGTNADPLETARQDPSVAGVAPSTVIGAISRRVVVVLGDHARPRPPGPRRHPHRRPRG